MTLSSLRQAGRPAPVPALVVALLPLAAPTPTLAQEAPPAPAADDGAAVAPAGDDEGVVETVSVSTYRSNGLPFAPQTTVTTDPSGRWRVKFENKISYVRGRRGWVRYDHASTRRLSGSGTYRANAHATLIRGSSYSGEYAFASHMQRCAGVTVVNRTARTCSSPRFSTSPGQQWYVISGHFYDHGNNGSIDAEVTGGMDYVWTAPRR